MPQPHGPRKNSTAGCRSSRSFGSACSAGHIHLAARGVLDGAIAAHERGEEILELALARITAADPQPLPARRGIDIEPGAEREFRDRIDVRHVDPVRAEIDGHAETARIGEAAAAGAVGGFQHDRALAGRHDAAGGGDAGRAGADDRDVDIGRAGLAERGRGGEARGRGQKRAASRSESWFPEGFHARMLIARNGGFSANGMAKRNVTAAPPQNQIATGL